MNITMYLPSWELGEPTWRVQRLATGPITEVQLGPAPHPFVVFRDLGDFDTMIGVLVGARAAHGEALSRHAARPLVPEPQHLPELAVGCDVCGAIPDGLCLNTATDQPMPGTVHSGRTLKWERQAQRDPDGMPAGWAEMHEDLADLPDPPPPALAAELREALAAVDRGEAQPLDAYLNKLEASDPQNVPLPVASAQRGETPEAGNVSDHGQGHPGDDEAQDAADRALRRAGVDPADLAELRGEDG